MIAIILFFYFCMFSLVIVIRSHKVLDERLEMTRKIFAQERWNYYLSLKEQVSFDYMMWHFWIWPIRKMWPNELQKLK